MHVRRHERYWWLLIGIACLPASRSAGERASAEVGASAPIFVVAGTRGTSWRGPLLRLGEDGTFDMAGAQATRIAWNQIVCARQEGVRLPPRVLGPQVLLVNGDRLCGEVVGLKGERLRFKPAVLSDQELVLPLSALAGLWREAPAGTDDPARFFRNWWAQRRGQDTLLLRNGDVVAGFVLALDDKPDSRTLRMQADKKNVDIDLGQVSALALAAETNRRRDQHCRARLILTDGSRLTMAAASADGETLVGTTTFGPALRLPLASVVAIYPLQGAVRALSDLEPSDYRYRPYLGEPALPYRKDASAAGNDLLLAGSTYDKGVGMCCGSRLSYRLDGGYRCFTALVGLDDRTGREGTARVGVLVDDKLVDIGAELTATNGPRSVRVDVRGAHTLTLLVDYGRRGNVQGHVDWADAFLIK